MKEVSSQKFPYRIVLIALGILVVAAALIFYPWPEECVGCKGVDQDIVSDMRALGKKTDSIYDNYGTYRFVCSKPTEEAGALDIIEAVEANSLNVVCHSEPTAWALEAQLQRDKDYYFCVDSVRTATFTKGSTIGDLRCGE